MKKLVIILILLLIGTVGAAVPASSFTKNQTSGLANLSVLFTDTSTGTPSTWNWSFGDGLWQNGTTQNATKTYTLGGTYSIFLISNNTDGSNRSATQTVTVIPLVSAFAMDRFIIRIQQLIKFNDTTTNTPSSWEWNFGDGVTSTDQNTTHVYTRPGSFTVVLNSTNWAGSSLSSNRVWVRNPYYSLSGYQEFMYNCQDMTYGVSLELNELERVITDKRIYKLCEL